MNIGFVGLGNMGGALALRLQLTHPLKVYDKNPARVQRLVEAGATACDGLTNLGEQCDLILLSLPNPDYVKEVLFGEGGLAKSARPGTIILDHTTGEPDSTREFARALKAHDITFLDAPVSGGGRRAAAGTITIMLGGEQEQLEPVMPILHAISPNIFHAGPLGAGQVIKLANNMLLYTQWIASLECLALAQKNGVDPRTAVDIIKTGTGRNPFIENTMDRILDGNLWSNAVMSLACKDNRLTAHLAAMSNVPMPVSNAATAFYQYALNELGPDAQQLEIANIVDRLAGSKVVPANYSVSDPARKD